MPAQNPCAPTFVLASGVCLTHSRLSFINSKKRSRSTSSTTFALAGRPVDIHQRAAWGEALREHGTVEFLSLVVTTQSFLKRTTEVVTTKSRTPIVQSLSANRLIPHLSLTTPPVPGINQVDEITPPPPCFRRAALFFLRRGLRRPDPRPAGCLPSLDGHTPDPAPDRRGAVALPALGQARVYQLLPGGDSPASPPGHALLRSRRGSISPLCCLPGLRLAAFHRQ